MKSFAAILALAASASAFSPVPANRASTAVKASAEGMPGILDPVGFFDPLGLAEKATDATLKRYREAELAHGRVSMLAVIGFLVGEKVEGSSFLFDASISGPAITHITQVPDGFWAVIVAFIGAYEATRAETGWVDPADCPVDQPGLLRDDFAHGRVSMLAVIGFLVGEKVEGSSFLFDASISGPAITHITQVPDGFWAVIIAFIGAYEATRAETGWVDPADCPVDQPGLLRDDYMPGDLKFDPLGLMPEDPEEFAIMQTKELQNGRLAMLAAAGFLAQEAVDGKGIIEHLQSM
eukprot:CAMPEP_0203661288 /NCGR_PEP_ID=MMETSP0088-20131115/59533_1 /ASSEMBLY_ACC=CAM_ASM_001087 /TAXON_ID=426623 /ORGANISM="Chaetoceros affinis, Strain CCMP159" /LENGTH=293 /DNA_ID=CAMNT_0050523951 /DNA_START=27 /DNA_END=908 /DNA_ORIENTATION=-